MDRDALEKQLAATKSELEQAKAQAYKCMGAIQMLEHWLSELDGSKNDQPADAPAPPQESTIAQAASA